MRKGFYIGLAVAVCTVYGIMLVPTAWRDTEATKPELEIVPPYDKPVHFYLGPWVWDAGGYWRAPEGTVGLVDLRGIVDCAVAEEARGVGFFACQQELGLPYVDLGSDLDAPCKEWFFPLDGEYTIREALWNTLTVWADPTGQDRAAPLMPFDGSVTLTCQTRATPESDDLAQAFLRTALEVNANIKRESWDGVDDEYWPVVQQALQSQYRNLPESIQGKVLTDWMDQYQIEDHSLFIPDDLPVAEPQPKNTEYSEDFDTANSDTLGPDLTWAEVSGDCDVESNAAVPGSRDTVSTARAEHDLSSANHYVQLKVATHTSAITTSYVGPCARFSSSANTFYTVLRYNSLGVYRWGLYKCVAGTFTALGVDADLADSTPETWRISCNGSTIGVTLAGFGMGSITDTAIAGGTRGGFYVHEGALGGDVAIDDFFEADIDSGSSYVVLINAPPIKSPLINGGLVH